MDAVWTLPYCLSPASPWLGCTNFQALLYNYYFFRTFRWVIGAQGSSSSFFIRDEEGALSLTRRPHLPICRVPQLMTPSGPSLSPPAQASPASPQHACPPGRTDHLPGVSYHLEGWLRLFQALSQVPATLRWPDLLPQAWKKTCSPFCFMFPFFSFYLEPWASAISELQKIVSMVLPKPNIKAETQDRSNTLLSNSMWEMPSLCQVSRDDLLLGWKKFEYVCT